MLFGTCIHWIGIILVVLNSSGPTLWGALRNACLLMSKWHMWLSFTFHRAQHIFLASYQFVSPKFTTQQSAAVEPDPQLGYIALNQLLPNISSSWVVLTIPLMPCSIFKQNWWQGHSRQSLLCPASKKVHICDYMRMPGIYATAQRIPAAHSAW